MTPNSRAANLLRQVSRQHSPSPVPRSILLELENEPAVHSLKSESLVTRASRTVGLAGGAHDHLSLSKSEFGEGLYELPQTIRRLPGLPGRSGDRHAVSRGTKKATTEASNLARVEGFIPDTEPITYNPRAAFSTRSNLFVTRHERDKRKLHRRESTASNETSIFGGGDDRVNIYPNGHPERCVCRLEVSIQQVPGGPWVFQKRGSGFMVGDRVMMTAGHVHPDGPYAGWMIKVVPGYYDGQSVYGPDFFSFASDYHYWEGDTGCDMMVCRLYDPLGTTCGFFGATSYNSDWEDRNLWSMCGYPFDIGESRPTFQGGIPVRDDDDGDDIDVPDGNSYDTTQVESEADEASGASGSPLYDWFDDGHVYAIGVHHGTETDYIFPTSSETWAAAAGGDGLVGIIRWARATWS